MGCESTNPFDLVSISLAVRSYFESLSALSLRSASLSYQTKWIRVASHSVLDILV